MDILQLKQQYQSNLLDDVIPFWSRHAVDDVHGGFFSCLDRKGQVYDTDKFTWLQARQIWVYAMLYNEIAPRQEWLDLAVHGAEFLQRHGRDDHGDWYFSLNRVGKPLTQPYNIFSDCFAAMAFAQLYKAVPLADYRNIAMETFERILARQDNPKGKYRKDFPGTRPLMGFSLPMILSNLVLEVEHIVSPQLVNDTIDRAIALVMDKFYHPALGLVHENIQPDGGISDSFEGRLINPGHTLEAMWFIMELADRKADSNLMEKAVQIAISTLEYGWDEAYGGLFYFKDSKGHPPLQLEWDQKLWWVHFEAIVCMLKAFDYSGNPACWSWFLKLHDYTWTHFKDSEYGEWFGYLNRQGEVLLPLKGGKWKISYHVVRSLYQSYRTLDSIAAKQHETLSGIIK
ncbi:MAG TPA: AGE family epimerase/isomerase [Parapedobacter sp.]|nr:AGE family epimerase/isomerase [Parapedobacter sp.]